MGVSKVKGGTVEFNADQFMLLATQQAVTAMKKATIFTQGVAKEMIGGTGTGILYRRRKQRGKRGSFKASDFHRASSPGDPPARDSGILANSVSHTVRNKGLVILGQVGSDISKIRGKGATSDPEYGLFLELGTANMEPRPWLRPTLIKAKPTINKIFKKAFK
jgi:hypothetical protein